jgi:hypothetical protein
MGNGGWAGPEMNDSDDEPGMPMAPMSDGIRTKLVKLKA